MSAAIPLDAVPLSYRSVFIGGQYRRLFTEEEWARCHPARWPQPATYRSHRSAWLRVPIARSGPGVGGRSGSRMSWRRWQVSHETGNRSRAGLPDAHLRERERLSVLRREDLPRPAPTLVAARALRAGVGRGAAEAPAVRLRRRRQSARDRRMTSELRPYPRRRTPTIRGGLLNGLPALAVSYSQMVHVFDEAGWTIVQIEPWDVVEDDRATGGFQFHAEHALRIEPNGMPQRCSVIVTQSLLPPECLAGTANVEWLHASVYLGDEISPTYEDMVTLHRAVFGRRRWAWQCFVPESAHINIKNALHLWGRIDGQNLLPDFGALGQI